MTAGHEDGTPGARGQMKASHADRERTIDALKAAFAQGRLAKDEFSLRAGQVLASRTYAELDALTSDIPARESSVQRPSRPGREPGPYEVAYLCGGPERVAVTAVVAMGQDGRVKISPARHRIVAARDEADHPVERAVLDAARWPGTGLRVLLDEVAGSEATGGVADGLRRRGLLGRHYLLAPGRELRDAFLADVPEDLRVAVLGTSGLDGDSELRQVLEAPDPPPGSTLVPKRRDKAGPGGDGLPPVTDVAGYPGIPGRW